jgi:hypothetical protein
MDLPNQLSFALANIDPIIAGEFSARFQRWVQCSPTKNTPRHELIIFFHVELSQVKDSIDTRGYLSEELDDATWVNNFMLYAYPVISRFWKRSMVGGVL